MQQVNLASRAIHNYQLDAEAVHQAQIADNVFVIGVLYHFAIEHDDKDFTPVCIHIRGRLTKAVYQLHAAFFQWGVLVSAKKYSIE